MRALQACRAIWSMRRPRRGEDGYVLATAVTLSFIVIITVSAVVTAQLGNIAATRRAAGQLESRAGSENALDQTFQKFLQTVESDPTGASLTAAVSKYGDENSWRWYRARNLEQLCSDPSDATPTCIHIGVKSLGTNDFLVEVTGRSRCYGGSIDENNGRYFGEGAKCIVTKYQQRVRKKQYFDYLSFTVLEEVVRGWVTSNPSAGPWRDYLTNGVAPVAYTGGDVLNGPVRTDGRFWACVSQNGPRPQFQEGAFASQAAFATPTGCWSVGGSIPTDQLSATVTSSIGLPETSTPLASVARQRGTYFTAQAAADKSEVIFYDTGEWSLGAGGIRRAVGNDAVLFFESRVRVRGTVKGRVTVATANEREILINGDLMYACMGNDDTERRDFMRSMNREEFRQKGCEDSLGLIAGRNMHILCQADLDNRGTNSPWDSAPRVDGNGTIAENPPCSGAAGTSTDGRDRFVVGALLTLGTGDNGVLTVDRWSSAAQINGTTPNLYFVGTMASRYRPIFGLAFGGAQGETVRGLSKKFTFDARLKDKQPPAFLEPSNAPWERIDLVEVPPCGPGIGGRPQGAGC